MVITIIFGGELCKNGCPLSSLRFIEGLINGLSTASADSLYSNLKVVRRLIVAKHDKASFQENEN